MGTEANKDCDNKEKAITADELEETVTTKEQLTNFANEVSILGLKQAVNPSYSYIRRAIWFCFVLVGFGFLIHHLKNRFDYYFSNPTTVSMNVTQNDTLIFPTVTVCNSAPFKASSLARNNETEIGNLFHVGHSGSPDWSLFNLSRTNWTDFYVRNGFQVEDMVVFCLWKTKECKSNAFRPVLTEFGLCHQFGGDGGDLQVDMEGSRYGLELFLDTQQSREYEGNVLDAGALILLHDMDDQPDMLNFAIRTVPGQSSLIVLKLKKLVNLPAPHGNCGERKLAYYKKHNMTLKTCGCRMVYYPKVKGYRDCSPRDIITCYFPLSENTTQIKQHCGCIEPCEILSFDYSISSSKMSPKAISSELNRTAESVEKDFVSVALYYTDMTYEEVVQQEAYSTLTLFADIGGALGLVLGSTLMTLAEILNFIFGLCVWKIPRWKNKILNAFRKQEGKDS
ncbi:acid-sensing ion channel 2-like [Lingula anatina]|uniref:Acid-sensing ion channel 2-like n=1 Tax=Lingula anatina TaxID=7574 RepID=A0A1S3JCT9_LINAN|nr:acid-sensing ion channel 2-like [Lingula anatina]|eukprot:XP_013408230.1 acid-sensing ion channel 2-like [Lingula anatina]